MDFSDELLYESKTVRDTGIIKLKAQQSEEKIFKKVKNLFFALWNNVGRLSREQVAEFYEVPVSTIDSNYKNYKDEFDLDGVKPFEGQDLRELKSILPIGQNANQAVVYTPSGVLRMGFILRDSLIAKSVRTQSIRFIQGIGQEIGKEEALKELIKYNSVLSPLIESNKLIVSAFYSPYWHLMKSTFSRNYPYGGIPKVFSHDSSEKSDFLSTDDIRKEIQFLSTYTDNCKLQGLKEHRYKLASEVRARYPHLTSDVFNFEVDSQAGTAVFMFQFDNLILDTTYLEDCISR